jgi:hypothetical protein
MATLVDDDGGALRLRTKLPTFARNETGKVEPAATAAVVLATAVMDDDDAVSDFRRVSRGCAHVVVTACCLVLLLLFTASAAKLLGVDAVAVELEETVCAALGKCVLLTGVVVVVVEEPLLGILDFLASEAGDAKETS